MADKITAKDVAEKKDGFVLIDVREADELAEDGTIEGAVNIMVVKTTVSAVVPSCIWQLNVY